MRQIINQFNWLTTEGIRVKKNFFYGVTVRFNVSLNLKRSEIVACAAARCRPTRRFCGIMLRC